MQFKQIVSVLPLFVGAVLATPAPAPAPAPQQAEASGSTAPTAPTAPTASGNAPGNAPSYYDGGYRYCRYDNCRPCCDREEPYYRDCDYPRWHEPPYSEYYPYRARTPYRAYECYRPGPLPPHPYSRFGCPCSKRAISGDDDSAHALTKRNAAAAPAPPLPEPDWVDSVIGNYGCCRDDCRDCCHHDNCHNRHGRCHDDHHDHHDHKDRHDDCHDDRGRCHDHCRDHCHDSCHDCCHDRCHDRCHDCCRDKCHGDHHGDHHGGGRGRDWFPTSGGGWEEMNVEAVASA